MRGRSSQRAYDGSDTPESSYRGGHRYQSSGARGRGRATGRGDHQGARGRGRFPASNGGRMQHQYRGTGGSPKPEQTVPEAISPNVRETFVHSTEEGDSSRAHAEKDVEQQLAKLSVQKESITTSSPATSSLKFPRRPGTGTMGKKCVIKTNHLSANVPERVIHHYDVSVVPEVTSLIRNRAVMDQLVKLHRVSELGNRFPAYDGRKGLYTSGPLPFESRVFVVTVAEEDDSSGTSTRKEKEYRVTLKLAGRADLGQLKLFLEGKQAELPQEALNILDIILKMLPTRRFYSIGRSFYSPVFGKSQPLGGGLESCRGFYQSIRPTQMGLSLNVDLACTPFIQAIDVIQFVSQLLNKDVSCGEPFSDDDRSAIKKALRSVKVEITHRGNMRRQFRICGLSLQSAMEHRFMDQESGTVKSVAEHFQQCHGYILKYPRLPCLQLGNPNRSNYFPMEVCKIVQGQRYSKKLKNSQITALLNEACQRPRDREHDIIGAVRECAYRQDPYLQEFGICISESLTSVVSRILPAPKLKYHDAGREKDCQPQVGQWNMKNKKVVNGGVVNNWICISFARDVQSSVSNEFCYELATMCNLSGMTFNLEPVLPTISSRPDQVEKALKARFHDCMTKLQPVGKELDLLIAILPEYNGSLYGDLKRICEVDLGLISQCCITKHVFKMNKQYLANVALKINAKVGGRNAVLWDALSGCIPLVTDEPTIIFGADVNHPHPGEDSSPSIAAVVASQDWPEITKYAGLVSAQPHRQELIQDLYNTREDPVKGAVSGGMIRELLISFRKSTRRKPQRIIFYRDGVSEGQFYQVLLYELEAIRKACASLEPNYQPPVTFIIVQKRHHTRLFPNDHSDTRSIDRSGNILPGTVVDTKICHPTDFDFYLCSHAGIRGTSRPTHYHVIWDDNRFTADELQSLTNSLCYTYARCTRAVSIVPPAYYADLAAFRARFYMELESSEGSSERKFEAVVKPLPKIKENMKKMMFY